MLWGRMSPGHPSVRRRLPTAAGDYQRAPAGLLGRGRTVAGERLDLRPGAGRGHCGGDGQADASAEVIAEGRRGRAGGGHAGVAAAALTGVELLDGVAEAIHWMILGSRRDGRAGVSLVRRRSGTDRDPSRRSRGRPGRQSSITAAARASNSGSAEEILRPLGGQTSAHRSVAGAKRSRALASGQRSRRSSFRVSSCSTARA